MNNDLLETIKIVDGQVQNIAYHQQRCDDSLSALKIQRRYTLQDHIKPPEKGTFRCRIIYNATSIDVSYHPYHPSIIRSLRLVHSDIEYPLKFADRTLLDALYEKRNECDDVLIVKNSYLSDTTKANIALYDGSRWYTPNTPLLYGTTRARLLDQKKIFTKELHLNEMDKFSKIAVMNAMIGFCIVENGIIT